MRLDVKLTEFLNISRSKAQMIIHKGYVYVNGLVITKASYDIDENDDICVKKMLDYVSRGGYKLEKAINLFEYDFNDKIIVDIGSSTGGFTDCSIKHGAKLVYAIDVGKMQLDQSLRNHPKVISMENTNFKNVDYFDCLIDYFVMDVSFISIKEIFPNIVRLSNPNSVLITLIKPQFEVGINKTKKGIVKDVKEHYRVINEVLSCARSCHLYLQNFTFSPIKGKNGNIEYLAAFHINKEEKAIDTRKIINSAFSILKNEGD